MNGKLPRITARQVIRGKAGFVLVRQSGSHKIYRNSEGKRVTVPYHSGKVLHPKVLKSILREANLSIKQFNELTK